MGYILQDESRLEPTMWLTEIWADRITLQEAVVKTVQYALLYTQTPDTKSLAEYIKKGFFSKEEKYGISLNMLFDLPVTATIIYDIINAGFSSTEKNNHTILDLWTGSWILGFAWLLHLKRHKQKSHIIGVEHHPDVAQRTHTFLQKIWAWDVVREDSEDTSIIQRLWIAPRQVTWIMNENLWQPGKHVHQEPFLPNLWNLRRWDVNIQQTLMFPYGISIENCGIQTLPNHLSLGNNFWNVLDQDGPTFKHPSIIWKRLKSNPNGSFHKVGWVWTEYYGNKARKIFNPEILRYLPSRWVDYTRD